MNITRNVVTDLLPAYFSGEASEDTRSIVEEYFEQHPEFEREARRSAEGLDQIRQIGSIPIDARLEQTALKRAKRLLRVQTILLALASTFSLNVISLGFSFQITNGHIHPHWLTLPGQSQVVGAIAVLAVILWALYFRIRRRIRTRILG
ncbi:MAG TPA: hypothetical protein VLV78_19040 [Thermoanaerobaculia bacterium]|nr:hypothetical protein [Thermoanaerobaculia bacterium]